MRIFLLAVLLPVAVAAQTTSVRTTAQTTRQYHIYSGNTHSHTKYSWSHGEQWVPSNCKGVGVFAPAAEGGPPVWQFEYPNGKGGPCLNMFVTNGLSLPSSDQKLRASWEKFQGGPADHFAAAKRDGYDFYATTDHSEEATFSPDFSKSAAWIQTAHDAEQASDKDFVALRGYEFSENDDPIGVGHINVINSAGMLNALADGVNLPYFYKWLATAAPSGIGPVVASFNHPGPYQYADFAYRTPAATEIITMLEVINSNTHIHYEGFINALDHGWKVAPVAGNDNHGLTGIPNQKSRTFVLATAKTKLAILDAMKHRRVYASLDNNIECRYTANGSLMGSTLQPAKQYRFHIVLSDPDTSKPGNKITKIDIVKDGGAVVQEWAPDSPGYTAEWSPTIADESAHFFFVRVWNAGGGDIPNADPAKPIAWLAPVWTGRPITETLPAVIPMPEPKNPLGN